MSRSAEPLRQSVKAKSTSLSHRDWPLCFLVAGSASTTGRQMHAALSVWMVVELMSIKDKKICMLVLVLVLVLVLLLHCIRVEQGDQT